MWTEASSNAIEENGACGETHMTRGILTPRLINDKERLNDPSGNVQGFQWSEQGLFS